MGRSQGEMSEDCFNQIVDEVHPYALTILTHFQGEPLLNSRIIEMIRYAKSKRIITEMATNATLIDEKMAIELVSSGLKKVVVTLDSVHEADFGRYRKGVRYEDVLNGIRNIQSAKQKLNSRYPILVLELLALKNNLNQIDDFIAFCRNQKADVIRVKTALILELSEAERKIPLDTKYSRYFKNQKGEITLKGNPNAACSAPWSKLSVTHNGWVLPCCFDKSGCYILGSLNFWSLREIWFSKHYNLFRKRLLTKRSQMPICCDCPQNRMPLDYRVG